MEGRVGFGRRRGFCFGLVFRVEAFGGGYFFDEGDGSKVLGFFEFVELVWVFGLVGLWVLFFFSCN